MILETILVGVDFSEATDALLEEAYDLAELSGASLVFARLCDIPPTPSWLDDLLGGDDPELEQLSLERLELESQALEDLEQRFSHRGVSVKRLLIKGRPAPGILDAARDAGADLIVVGHRGRSGDENGRLGGVAARVARTAPIPVLVTRHDGHSDGGYRRVLVPTDFSGSSDLLMQAADAVSAPDATIDLLHCWRLPMDTYSRAVFHDSPEDLHRETIVRISRRARERGEAVAARSRTGRRTVQFRLIESRARTGIIRQLEKGAHDLVVVGSHGQGGFQPFGIGSTAAATVRRSPSSVLMVPVGKRTDEP